MIKKSLITLSLMAAACTVYAQLPSAASPSLAEKPNVSYFKAAKQNVRPTATSSAVKTAPYVATFVTEDMFNAFTVINANNDQKSNGKECTWYYNDELQTARYSYSGDNDADDWLISPAIALEAGSSYTLTVNCKNYKSTYYGDYEEKFEVQLGTLPTVEGMSKVIMSKKTVRGGVFKDFTQTEITVAESGIYYLGVHCVSDAYRGELDVKSIQLDVIPNDAAPAGCTSVEIEADETGEASATLSFKAPTKTYDGGTLSGTMSIRIRRNGDDIKLFENVTPGQALTYVDSDNVPNGTNNYQIIASNTAGTGAVVEDNVFVGVDTPKAVTNVAIVENNATTMTISWDAVDTEGENGEVVNPDKVIYVVYSTLLDGSSLSLDEQIGYVKGETSFTFNYNSDEGTQQRKYWAVFPVNIAGTGEGATCSHYVGTPHALPFEEHMTTTAFQNDTWSYTVSAPKYVILALSTASSDGDGNALMLYTTEANQWGALTAGKIAMKGAANPAITFDALSSSSINPIHVNIITPDGKSKSFAEFIPTTSYQTYRFDLSEFANERYVRFEIYGDFKNIGAFCFDNISVADIQANDLSLRLNAPTTVPMGNSDAALVTATVRNEGSANVSSFNIRLTSGNTLIADETINATLAPLESYTADFKLPVSLLRRVHSITVNGEVILGSDTNAANNTATATTTVKSSGLPEPTEVALSEDTNSATLTWNEPDNYDAEITEGFEDQTVFPAFSTGNLKNQYGSFDEWTLYDGDNATTYGYNNYAYDNRNDESAWQVMNPGQISGLLDDWDNYAAHSGEQYLVAWCPNEGSAADNWLISPELPGTEQTLSFYYAAENDQYGNETLEVLASSTDNAYTSFELVKTFEFYSLDWTKGSVTLPEGSKYFALRHTSNDIFGMMIDDITYTSGAKTQLGYNIYLDGKLLTTLATTAKSYTFENIPASEGHTFAVSATYANDLESNPVTIDNVAGIENVLSDKPAATGVAYDLYGRRVSPDTKGLIIIDGKKVINK